jgi:hypothetical protein
MFSQVWKPDISQSPIINILYQQVARKRYIFDQIAEQVQSKWQTVLA